MEHAQFKQAQVEKLRGWEDAMHFGLMGGRPFAKVACIPMPVTQNGFVEQYGCLAVERLKPVLLAIPS